jgi:hypothetical protein
MIRRKHLQAGAVGILLGGAAGLFAAGSFLGAYRESYVYGPKERAVEEAITLLAERQRAALKTGGKFVPFGSAAIDRSPTFLGLPWTNYPIDDYQFDAEILPSGNLRMRALPRPERITNFALRPRIYAAELNSAGTLLRPGWSPSS